MRRIMAGNIKVVGAGCSARFIDRMIGGRTGRSPRGLAVGREEFVSTATSPRRDSRIRACGTSRSGRASTGWRSRSNRRSYLPEAPHPEKLGLHRVPVPVPPTHSACRCGRALRGVRRSMPAAAWEHRPDPSAGSSALERVVCRFGCFDIAGGCFSRSRILARNRLEIRCRTFEHRLAHAPRLGRGRN